MIRASPCDYYLRYLCSHPDKYADHQIRSLIGLQGLDFAGVDHLERLRRRTTPPDPFYPENLQHHESQRFLTKERIYFLYHYDEDTRIALNLLDNPRGKELVESVLASGGALAWACTMLRRIQFTATPRAIELYRHFFFNTELVNSVELRAFLHMRIRVDVNPGDSDAVRYREAYRRVAKDDLASLPVSSVLAPFSRILNFIRLGVMPSGADVSRIATVARTAAIVRSAENTLLGKAERARDFALTGKLMTELLDSVGDVSSDLQRSMTNMLLLTDTARVPSIQSLTEGDISEGTPPLYTVGDLDAEGEEVPVGK